MNKKNIFFTVIIAFLSCFSCLQAQERGIRRPADEDEGADRRIIRARLDDPELQELLDLYNPTSDRCRPSIRMVNGQVVNDAESLLNDDSYATLACMLGGYKNIAFDITPSKLDDDLAELLQKYRLSFITYRINYENNNNILETVGDAHIWFMHGFRQQAELLLKAVIQSEIENFPPFAYSSASLAGYSEDDIRAFYRQQNIENELALDRADFNSWKQANPPETVRRWIDLHNNEYTIKSGLLHEYEPEGGWLESESEEDVSNSESDSEPQDLD